MKHAGTRNLPVTIAIYENGRSRHRSDGRLRYIRSIYDGRDEYREERRDNADKADDSGHESQHDNDDPRDHHER